MKRLISKYLNVEYEEHNFVRTLLFLVLLGCNIGSAIAFDVKKLYFGVEALYSNSDVFDGTFAGEHSLGTGRERRSGDAAHDPPEQWIGQPCSWCQ